MYILVSIDREDVRLLLPEAFATREEAVARLRTSLADSADASAVAESIRLVDLDTAAPVVVLTAPSVPGQLAETPLLAQSERETEEAEHGIPLESEAGPEFEPGEALDGEPDLIGAPDVVPAREEISVPESETIGDVTDSEDERPPVPTIEDDVEIVQEAVPVPEPSPLEPRDGEDTEGLAAALQRATEQLLSAGVEDMDALDETESIAVVDDLDDSDAQPWEGAIEGDASRPVEAAESTDDEIDIGEPMGVAEVGQEAPSAPSWPWEIESGESATEEEETSAPSSASDTTLAPEVQADVSSIPQEAVAGYGGSGLDMGAYTCEDCVYDSTCPQRGEQTPANCGSFQWKST